MKRIYHKFITNHFKKYEKMLFIMGPRQVGKTTQSMRFGDEGESFYFNWDDSADRSMIIQGTHVVAKHIGLTEEVGIDKMIVFDEIHKFHDWKNFVKGFYDKYHSPTTKIIVTGSAKLDTYRKGGDSIMGRYFKLRMHPISVGEIVDDTLRETEILTHSQEISTETYNNLLQFGGFPEPFIASDSQLYTLWQSTRDQQLLREDVRDVTRVQEISQLEVLAEFIRLQSGQLISYSSFARKVRVSVDTIQRWIQVLQSLYFCFKIRPWTKNISRTLLKEPKLYLWDWSPLKDRGALYENFIASHLLKATHYWTDRGFGTYDLYFLRTKEKREVDFLVTKNEEPWFLVEAKASGRKNLSPQLEYFQKMIGAKHAFQVNCEMDYIDINCFEYEHPIIVPAKTFLSQLV
jgi:predicted AAA+ superfamily ATPase